MCSVGAAEIYRNGGTVDVLNGEPARDDYRQAYRIDHWMLASERADATTPTLAAWHAHLRLHHAALAAFMDGGAITLMKRHLTCRLAVGSPVLGGILGPEL